MKFSFLFFASFSLFFIGYLDFSKANLTPVKDPKNLLSQVDAWLGKQEFQSALICGDQATYFNYIEKCDLTCSKGLCTSLCYQKPFEFLKTVSNCTAEGVSIYADDGTNVHYTQMDFDAIHGNFLRPLLSEMGDYVGYAGSITLDQMVSTKYEVGKGTPGVHNLEAMDIKGRFFIPGDEMGFDIVITLGRNVGGVAQVLRYRVADTWYRLKDYPKK